MYHCMQCGLDFSTVEEYNRHIRLRACYSDDNMWNEPSTDRMVYTKSGDPIPLKDDISEFLNQDDDDYVP